MARAASRKKSGGGAGLAIGIVVVIAILAIAGGGAWYFLLRSTPEKTVTKFLDAAQAGNSDVAKTCLSEESLKMWDRMAGMFKLSEQKGGEKGKKEKAYKVGQAKASGSTVTVPVTTQIPANIATLFAGKTELEVPFACIKEKGKWKVDIGQTAQAMLRQFIPGGMPRH